MKNYAIILASGKGERFDKNCPKQFFLLNDKPVIIHSIEAFEKNKFIDEIIVVINPDFRDKFLEILSVYKFNKIKAVLDGGKTRQESSFNGINFIKDEEALVLIHDAVRPLVSQRIIDDCISTLKEVDAVNVCMEVVDTIVEIDENNEIKATLNRNLLKRVQTPQGFKLSTIRKAHELSKNSEFITDDCGMVMRHNISPVRIVTGEEKNIKITHREDLKIAEQFLLKN